MARNWLSVTVELLGGRGEELWPWPGRTFAVGPTQTFLDLGNAIAKRSIYAAAPRARLVRTCARGARGGNGEGADATSRIRDPRRTLAA